eukprot:6706140-Pyramimonas_sp.AAC.1
MGDPCSRVNETANAFPLLSAREGVPSVRRLLGPASRVPPPRFRSLPRDLPDLRGRAPRPPESGSR